MSLKESLPTQARALGEELRRLREAAGVGLDEIIADTKVSRRILEALESGRYQYLPESVFSRNFVRQYARIIGEDEEPLVEAFQAAWERFRLSSGSHPIVVPVPAQAPVNLRRWLPVMVAALVLAVAVGMMLVRRPRQTERLDPDPRRIVAGLPTPTVLPIELMSSPTPSGDQEAADAAASDDGSVLAIRVTVSEGRECWIHYRDREGHTGQRLLGSGEELRLDLAGPALLSVGNAAAVTIDVNGRRYEGLGRSGQVIHCEIGSDGLVRLGNRARDE